MIAARATCDSPLLTRSLDPLPLQRLPQSCQNRIQPPVHVELRRESHHFGDLASAGTVLEPECEQQAVAVRQPAQRVLKGTGQLPLYDGGCRVGRGMIPQGLDFDVVAHQIGETPAGGLYVVAAGSGITRFALPTVAAPVVVRTHALRNDYEPRAELGCGPSGVGAELLEIVCAELIEDVRVTIHDGVIAAPQGARRMQDQATVSVNKTLPGLSANRFVRG